MKLHSLQNIGNISVSSGQSERKIIQPQPQIRNEETSEIKKRNVRELAE
jgi:hypothetical protein